MSGRPDKGIPCAYKVGICKTVQDSNVLVTRTAKRWITFSIPWTPMVFLKKGYSGPVKLSSLQNSLQGAFKVLTTILSILCFSQVGGKEILSRYTTFFWLIDPEFPLSPQIFNQETALVQGKARHRDKRVAQDRKKITTRDWQRDQHIHSFILPPSPSLAQIFSLLTHMAQQGLSTAPNFLFLSSHYSLSSGLESQFLNKSIWLAQPLGARAWANQLS